jgi:hypothetical protein
VVDYDLTVDDGELFTLSAHRAATRDVAEALAGFYQPTRRDPLATAW